MQGGSGQLGVGELLLFEPPLGGVLVDEGPRDVDAPRDPDVPSLLAVIDEAGERVGAGWMPTEARMEADRHHAVQTVALPAQEVHVRLGVFEEVLGASVSLR